MLDLPLWKIMEFVRLDHPPNTWGSHKINVPNHQPDLNHPAIRSGFSIVNHPAGFWHPRRPGTDGTDIPSTVRPPSVHAIKDAPDEGTWQGRQPGADVMGGCEIRKSLTGWLKTYTKWHVYHQLVQDFATIHRMKPCLKCFWSFQNKSQLVTSSLIRMWPCLVNLGLGWIGELLGETSTATSDSSELVSTMEIPVLHHGFSR